jgi:GWxTD domain-containing protein
MRHIFPFLCFALLLTNVAQAQQPLPKASDDWAVTSIKGKFLAIDSTTARIYLDMTAKKPAVTADEATRLTVAELGEHFVVNYVVYPDYNNRERLLYGNVPITAQSVRQIGDHLLLTFDLKRPKPADGRNIANGVLLTEITETATGKKALNDLPLRFRATNLNDRITLFDPKSGLPLLRHYVNIGDTVLLGDVSGSRQTLYGFRYKHDFEAASSPMNTAPRPAPRQLATDSVLTITTNVPLVLPREGLYFFVADTADAAGLGVVVADQRFPRLTRPEKLVKPLLYVSTSSENSELASAPDPKKALDRYWLGLMGGSEDVARRMIRGYYGRVEEANRLFTTYKEGWKTDKGMIYIVLGAPDRVQRSRDREVWVYNRKANSSEVNFTFNRKQNQFVEDHYELVRYVEYQPIWYPVVEAWRTGTVRDE